VHALARLTTCALVACLTPVASAQDADAPSLARAGALIEDADFESAREVLRTLAAGEGFSESDVLVWLELSMLVEFAIGGTPPEPELGALLALDPDRQLGEAVPPDLRDALDALRARPHPPLEIAVEATSTAGRYRLRAVVSNDGASIVREPRVFARPAGERSWRASEDGALAIETAAAELAYYAEAIGPGGAVVARQGSADAPLVLRSQARAPEVEPVVPEDDGDFPVAAVAIVSAGTAVAIGVAVVLALVLPVSPSSPLDRPTFPLPP
jgi:hypothetical protein